MHSCFIHEGAFCSLGAFSCLFCVLIYENKRPLDSYDCPDQSYRGNMKKLAFISTQAK